MTVGPGTLKCVVALDGDAAQIERALRDHIRPEDLRRASESALLIHTEAGTADIRDWLAPVAVLVLEFETWSAYGDAVDRDWLRERGH